MPQEKPKPRRRIIEEPQKPRKVHVEREPVKRKGNLPGKSGTTGQPEERQPMRRGTGPDPMRRGGSDVEREPRRREQRRDIDIEHEPREEKGGNTDIERQ